MSSLIYEIVELKYTVLEEGSITNLKEWNLGETLSSSIIEKRKEGVTVTPFHNVRPRKTNDHPRVPPKFHSSKFKIEASSTFRSLSQGVDCLICLPKTAWPPTYLTGQLDKYGAIR